jgi:uncharacterized protein YxjI|tara:strand:+ start:201 stop:809 length:609 start_codon:yes stop_codon:yes gene_type:complete
MDQSAPPVLLDQFQHNTYLVRQKILKLFGAAFHIYDASGNLAFYSKQKAFKLKEDIRVYTGEDMQTELLTIRTDQILDIGATYQVHDPQQGGVHVGSLRRKGLKSIIRDEWVFLNPEGQEIGLIQEDSTALALLRRFYLGWLLPQQYDGMLGNVPVCNFKRNFNPFVSKVTLDYSMDQQGLLDRRLGIAAAVLLVAIEGKQN